MKKFLFCLAAVAAIVPSAALAAKTQVSQDSWKAAGKTGYIYGRSDGVFQDTTSYGLWSVENGTAAQPLGPTFYEDFTKYGASKGMYCMTPAGLTCADSTNGQSAVLVFGDGLRLVFQSIATNGTLYPITVAQGLDISGDATNNDGIEIASGLPGASGRPFVIGDDPAFYTCGTFTLGDVDGSDDFHFGFRRAEPWNATFDNYLDLVSIGNISGDIKIETIDDNAATVTTDTTADWADDATHKLCVYISGAGVVTYTIDGAAPSTTAAVTFDDGDPVVPFVHLLHDTNVANGTFWTKWEVGYSN